MITANELIIDDKDAFQAAIAQHHQIKRVIRDTKDFPIGQHDFVIVPYQI